MASSSKSTIRVKQPKELLAVEPENPPQCAVHVVEVRFNFSMTFSVAVAIYLHHFNIGKHKLYNYFSQTCVRIKNF